jgi:hypothetical protein
MVLTLAVLAGGAGGAVVVMFAILAVLVYLGGVITEIVGWFGLRGLDGHRGWATAVAVLLIIECSWMLVGPAFFAAALEEPIGFAVGTCLLLTARATLMAVGFWVHRGVAARVAAAAFSLAAIGWLVLVVAVADGKFRLLGAAIAAAIIAALCEGIGHFATGAYFGEKRPIPVDVSAFT